MVPLSRYWEILKLDPAADGVGYKRQLLSLARQFFQDNFPDLLDSGVNSIACLDRSTVQHQSTQRSLHQLFFAHPVTNEQRAATAGLCLRCYVSYAIVSSCQRVARLFASHFTYRELLPYVLEDDGKNPIILDHDDKTQLILERDGSCRSTDFSIFAIEILRTYDPNRSAETRASLESWVYRYVKQNTKLKAFIAEQGLCGLSNWALLNRASDRQLGDFSPRERALVQVFHRVYRRDRRHHRQQQHGKCPDPTPHQLQEMGRYLQEQGIHLDSSTLLHELHTLATALRQLERWIGSGAPLAEPIEVDPETGHIKQIPDLREEMDVDTIEVQEIQTFCHQQLLCSLEQAIAAGLCEHVTSLQNRPRYAKFANAVPRGLWLIYDQGKSQKEIAPLLGMTSQMQVSRVLALKELLGRVRRYTVERLFQRMLDLVAQLDLGQVRTKPDYIQNLQAAVEAFVDDEIFQEAEAEIMTTKHRAFNSLYAQQLRQQIQNQQTQNQRIQSQWIQSDQEVRPA